MSIESTHDRLLAKSTPPMGLRKHTALVLAAAEALLDARATASLRAVGLPLEWEDRLRRVVRLGAFVHDLGKCSDHFQRMLRGSAKPQLVRHEALSAWLVRPGGILGEWLAGAVEDPRELDVAVIAAAGHHRKFSTDLPSRDADPLTVLLSHPDFMRTCALGHKLGLASPPALADVVLHRVKLVRDAVVDWDASLALGPKWRLLLAVAKALVITADVAGSALPAAASHERKPQWIRDQLGRCDPAAAARVVRHRLGGNALRPFQARVRDGSAPVVLVQAGCGGGKTIAAYAWAAAQHPGRRLWITYPTTGTTTEGYLGYLQGAEVEGRLEHSRASVDVELFDIDERVEGASADDGEVMVRCARGLDRLDALRHWGSDVVTCTVDTVLGLLVDQRRGLYAWPSLCDAAVVFDEIHAYDERLFGLLLRFLRDLPGVPALLMTASLPRARRQALDAVVLEVHQREMPVVEGEADAEALSRYTIERRSTDPVDDVVDALGRDEKVLWVCNTVSRALVTAKRLEHLGPLVYHSRYRYVDRVERHRDVVQAFDRPGPALAVTTQVCEMSLDLSADLLVTDLAPVPAMIQRLGRLNRRSPPKGPKPCLVLPFEGQPYDRGLPEAEAWIVRLGERRALGQRDLVRAWEAYDPPAPPRSVVVDAIWLDGGMETTPRPCRDASPGLSVLRDSDAQDVRRRRRTVAEVVLPMPPPPGHLAKAWRGWDRVLGVPVAPPNTIEYDPRHGGRWRDQEAP